MEHWLVPTGFEQIKRKVGFHEVYGYRDVSGLCALGKRWLVDQNVPPAFAKHINVGTLQAEDVGF
jgi:hypothetical protein